MHSPFIFDFILHVLNSNKAYAASPETEALRKELKNNHTLLQIEDLGAGSRMHNAKQKAVSHLVKTAVKPKKYGQLLYRLAKHYKPETVVELGTSLGLTTAYLAKAVPSANVITIEGSAAIHQLAEQHFTRLGLGNIQAFRGNFDDLLPGILPSLNKVDLAYIDGNHRREPALRYFEQLLSKAHNETILVFDDIHWSREMEEAWQIIKTHSAVRCTVDVFFLGFVFFRREFKEQQHFSIRF